MKRSAVGLRRLTWDKYWGSSICITSDTEDIEVMRNCRDVGLKRTIS